MGVNKTTEQFIEDAKKVHGDKYDYSLVEYTKGSDKVKIICPIHGIFEQRANDHTSHKNGCIKCANEARFKKITLSEDKALGNLKAYWDGLYEYPDFKYENCFSIINIKCEKHGIFEKSYTKHLSGIGCPICSKENRKEYRNDVEIVTITKDLFLQRAKNLHGDKFNYENINYVDYSKTPITFKCNIHNIEVTQIPKSHLYNKGGCLECKREAVRKAQVKSESLFINEASEKHDNFYDYSKVNYVNSKTSVDIICPIHGVFPQTPNDHLSGHGCKKCGQKGSTYNITKAERNKEEWSKIQTVLYLIEFKSEDENYVKIGISNNKEIRHSVLERVSKCKIVDSLIIDIDLYNAVIMEQSILKQIKYCKHLPLYNYPGYTECFKIDCKEEVKNKIINFLEKDLQ